MSKEILTEYNNKRRKSLQNTTITCLITATIWLVLIIFYPISPTVMDYDGLSVCLFVVIIIRAGIHILYLKYLDSKLHDFVFKHLDCIKEIKETNSLTENSYQIKLEKDGVSCFFTGQYKLRYCDNKISHNNTFTIKRTEDSFVVYKNIYKPADDKNFMIEE
ncbi:MAG: hypothetical protein K6B67_05625 [Lachnospiraceae bacterium]|nr:hypothetical protein [Lachnospiraceae bacterium]